MAGIITAKRQKSIIVNGMPDHTHIFVGLRPSMAVSDLVRDVKNNSTNFINERHFVKGKFFWQEGFGAFSYSHSQVKGVYDYIGRASCGKDIQRGIHRFFEKIRNSV